MRPPIELLAPAGSIESMKAAVNAGADAVYMGGSRFGARAYADNPEEDRFLEALDYAHLHGCRLYMTVNTLVKEAELPLLYDFLKPCYERGLDAVIVQDMGVLAFIREHFPDLHIHASTQMTVTGYRSAALLKELGVTRIVTARELSLDELRRIHDKVDMEIEAFVHGALCYCYSGQCLLSSLIGGRSGNRGRCAQPCRLPYDVAGDRGHGERYVLNLKDLCALDVLPDMIGAGVYSLKIEGRMKSPRYTAGVVGIYRKYVDRCLEYGRKDYRVDPQDKRLLLDLFDRGGFTEGYFRRHNGREMVALGEKPAFREANQALFDRLDREYVDKVKQEPVRGRVVLTEGAPARLELWPAKAGSAESAGSAEPAPFVTVTGPVAMTAQKQPLTRDSLLKQMNKTGGSPFFFESLEAEVTGACFLPVSAQNELRRQGLEALEEKILSGFRRRALEPAGKEAAGAEIPGSTVPRKEPKPWPPRIVASLEEPDGLETAIAHRDVDGVCLHAAGFEPEDWRKAVESCHRAGKTCGLVLPHIFRKEAEDYLKAHSRELREAGVDELTLGSLEEVEFVRELGITDVLLVFDANLYAMNHLAAGQLRRLGAARLTFPLELNSRELEELEKGEGKPAGTGGGWQMVAYGHLPVMVSAQCVVRTKKGCTKRPEVLRLKDRTGKELPVKNHCRFCCNTVYNPDPLSLLGMERTVKLLGPEVLRLDFTVETPDQVRAVLDAYGDHFRRGKDTPVPFGAFTRGHLKRGVE